MSAPSVLVMEGVDDYLRKHALEEARMYGHEVLGWLVGFSMKNEVYVLKAVKCTRYRRQSRIEAEADPTQESEVASRYPRNIGLVGQRDRPMAHPMVDRRKRLQEILDEIEPGWFVIRPTGPGDIVSLCILQKPSDHKEACDDIPQKWFEDGEDHLIRYKVREAISHAIVKS